MESIGDAILRVCLFLDPTAVSQLACVSKQTVFLNAEKHWASRCRQSWIATTLKAYLRLPTWRKACEAALVFDGLCGAARALGADVPALPHASPYAVRVATVDRTVEALSVLVSEADGASDLLWSGALHLAIFYLIVLRQIPAFRRDLPSTCFSCPSRDIPAMRSEVPVIAWAAFIFLGDALPSSREGFARRWLGGPSTTLIRSTIALLKIVVRPTTRCCLNLLRHTHPATRDPVRDAAAVLLSRVVASSHALAAAVPFASDQVIAAATQIVPGTPPRCVPREHLEMLVRNALAQQCGTLVGDGIWEELERIVLPLWCHVPPRTTAGDGSVEAAVSTSIWSVWQEGLATLPLDVAEAAVIGACMSLAQDPDVLTRPHGLRVGHILVPSESAATAPVSSSELVLQESDFIPGSDGFKPYNMDHSRRRWQAQHLSKPQHAAPQRGPSVPWPEWTVLAARGVAEGLFESSKPTNLAAVALADPDAPLRVLLKDLEHREAALAAHHDSRFAVYDRRSSIDLLDAPGAPKPTDTTSLAFWGGGSEPAWPRRVESVLASLEWLLRHETSEPADSPSLEPVSLRDVEIPCAAERPCGNVALVQAILKSNLLLRSAAWLLDLVFPHLMAGPLAGYVRLVASGRWSPLPVLPAPLVISRAQLRWLHMRPSPEAQAAHLDAEVEMLDRAVQDPGSSGDASSPPGLSCRLLSQPTDAHPAHVETRAECQSCCDVADPWGVFPPFHMRSPAVLEASVRVFSSFVQALSPVAPPLVLLKVGPGGSSFCLGKDHSHPRMHSSSSKRCITGRLTLKSAIRWLRSPLLVSCCRAFRPSSHHPA